MSAADSCPYARLGLQFYRSRFTYHQIQRGASIPKWRSPRGCADARFLAQVWAKRAYRARAETALWRQAQAERTLHDFRVTPGSSAWERAVREVQKVYPSTDGWLLSCSASEGGHGRWVPNSQGSGVGGWLQFYPSTWSGFYRHASTEVRSRGFSIPSSAASWYSPLGQALAGAWGITHGMGHHWAGSGCR